jgi:hypothetical protein
LPEEIHFGDESSLNQRSGYSSAMLPLLYRIDEAGDRSNLLSSAPCSNFTLLEAAIFNDSPV